MKSVSLAEFHEQMKAQGVPFEHVAFKCVMCGTIQSAQSLINAGAGKTLDEVEKYIAFSCVGRWTNAGPQTRGTAPGKGCDWTLGGLFRIHKVEVVYPDGSGRACFELATPEEARELMSRHIPASSGTQLDTAPQGKLPWPSDAVMIVASVAGEEKREQMEDVHVCQCRRCDRTLHADTKTIRTAEQFPERRGRPVQFFCVECAVLHDRGDINLLVDQRGGRNEVIRKGQSCPT